MEIAPLTTAVQRLVQGIVEHDHLPGLQIHEIGHRQERPFQADIQ